MLFVIAMNAFFLLVGICVGVKMRGQIPLRLPSNRVRLSNVKADTESVLMRAETDKTLAELDRDRAELDRDRRRAELEAEFIEARARTAMRELAAAENVAADDDVGVLIASVRGKRKLTQQAVSVGTRIPARRISAIEHGDTATLSELRTLAAYLGLEFVPATLKPGVPGVLADPVDPAEHARIAREAFVAMQHDTNRQVKELHS